MTITSHVEGRLRIRDPRLRQVKILNALREQLLAQPDIRAVSANPRTASLLILYNTTRGAVVKITDLLARSLGRLVPSRVPATCVSRKAPRSVSAPLLSKRHALNLGMLLSLLATLAALGTGSKAHALAGAVFLGLLALHLLEKRATLLI